MKNTFQSHTFAAHTFASGTWNGIGVTPIPIEVEGDFLKLFGTETQAILTYGTWNGYIRILGPDQEQLFGSGDDFMGVFGVSEEFVEMVGL